MEDVSQLSLERDISQKTPCVDRTSIVELVRKFGGSTADAVLDPAMQFFFHEGIQGFISYRFELRCAITYGDPICAPEDRDKLARAFHRYADENNIKIIYISASYEYAHWAVKNVCGSLIEFGEELIFAPPYDPRKNTGNYGSLVRRKTKQAAREGVTIHEYIPHNSAIEAAMENVKDLWLQSRKGLQVHISNVYLFNDSVGKRWFYASQGERMIGLIVLNRIESQNGWLLNHLIVIPDAPNGVRELLMASSLETLEKEGCPFASVGSIAAHQLGEIQGMGKLAKTVARTVFKIASKVIHLEGLNTFWGKFHPKSRPSFLLFNRARISIRELMGLQRALSGPPKRPPLK